jgi:hypothetical protein
LRGDIGLLSTLERARVDALINNDVRHSTTRNSASLGAPLREPGIHNHHREYGFRACAKRAHPGMTNVGSESAIELNRDPGAQDPISHNAVRQLILWYLFEANLDRAEIGELHDKGVAISLRSSRTAYLALTAVSASGKIIQQ